MKKAEKLVQEFVRLSAVVNDNLYEGKFENTNSAVKKMGQIYIELKQRGNLELMKKLMGDDNPSYLQLDAASFLFDDYKEEAIKIFKKISQGNDKLAFSAKWGLQARLGKSS